MLSELFSSQERLKVIVCMFYNPEKEFAVRAIAKKVLASPTLVSRTIKLLKKEGLVKGNKIDLLNPFVKAIKVLLNIQKLTKAKIVQKSTALFKGSSGIGLYGSWANGTNNFESDLDLWIKTENQSDEKTAKLTALIREKIGIETNIILLTKKKLKELKEKDFVFYCALHNSFVLWGEGI